MKTSGYLPQLDGLRALAVFAVLCHHYLPSSDLNLWANAGVKLFFVLSGFLITGILLKSRDIREGKKEPWHFQVRQFYARRFLRIFPLYYAVIAAGLVLGLEPVREILPWLLTYTLNFFMAFQGWFVDHFAHFWTLAVEEQFYIVWPWFVLFAPRRWLIPVCLLFAASGPLFRLYLIVTGFKGLEVYILTPACLDSLCAGALLAVVNHFSLESSRHTQRIAKRIVTLSGALGVAWLIFFNRGESAWKIDTVLFDTVLALSFCGLIDKASQGFSGILGRILQSRPLTYLGKISYGLYVYHPFMPRLLRYMVEKAGLDLRPESNLEFVLSSLMTLFIASLSWYLMENPINGLKKYFEYDSRPGLNPKVRPA